MPRDLKILIVDDSQGDADVLLLELRQAGFRTTTQRVCTEEGLVAALSDAAYDMILVDHSMPGFSGLQACVIIREQDEHTPIIMVSGAVGEEAAVNAMRAGAQDFVLKDRLARLPGIVARELKEADARNEYRKTRQALQESEERLALSQQRFQLAMRGANDGLWDWDLVANTVYYSPRWKGMLGYAEDEIGDAPEEFFERLHPEDQVVASKAVDAYRKGETSIYEVEVRMRHKDGQFRMILSRGLGVRDEAGQMIRMVGTHVDLTRQKENEELRERNVFLQMRNMVAVVANQADDLESIIQATLDGVCKYAGWPLGHAYVLSTQSDDLLEPTKIWNTNSDKGFRSFQRVTEETTFRSGVGLPGRVLASGKPAWIFDVHKDDNFPRARLASDIEVHGAFAFPVKIESKVIAVLEFYAVESKQPEPLLLEIMEDVGAQLGRVVARRRAESALSESEEELRKRNIEIRELNDELEQRVAKRTAELLAANVRLEEANRAKSRFLSSMSHELRTPLNAILGFTDLLKGQHFGDLNEKQMQYAERVHDSGRHLLDLINDLLDMARIDAGAVDLELMTVSAVEIVESVVAMMGSQSRIKRLKIETQIDPNLTSITVDIRKFKQILLNLLSNAVKYTPAGGQITVRGGLTFEKEARFEVQDTGVGIPIEEQENIFSEFHQVDRARDDQLGGVGIGLALTRRLVELHGGRITVQSELGEGSTFQVTLLMVPGQDEESKERQKTPTALRRLAKGRKRIVVAEDNDVNLALILDMLSIRDYDVIVARNGQEAIDLVQAKRPDLVLMDIRMPVIDGLTATRRIREIPGFEDLPIIALTASASTESQEKQIAAGCTAHISKPVQLVALFAALDEYLEQEA